MKSVFYKLKLALLVTILSLCVGMVGYSPSVLAAGAKDEVCTGVNSTGTGQNPDLACSAGDGSIQNVVTWVVNILSVIVGITAIIMIIIGGFKYVTSSGESSNMASAKNTIVWAFVGLVVVATAQILVKFVLHRASLPPCPVGRTQISVPGDCIKS